MPYLTNDSLKERISKRFRCQTKVIDGPKPHLIDYEIYGHHSSYVEDGIRYWGFIEEAGRDKFVKDFNDWKAL